MPKPFRRIVTTNDANGRSEVHLDGPATNELATVLIEMWVAGAGPHDHTDRVDHAAKSNNLDPPAGGSVFRFVRLPPASAFAGMTQEQREQRMAEVFASMNAAHTRRDISKGPGTGPTRRTTSSSFPGKSGWFSTRWSAISSRLTLSFSAEPTTRGSIPAAMKRC